jgi:hydrogenase nickel incorporation protein HypA/HybF
MHEVSICHNIIETLETELEEKQFPLLREVHVKIGALSCVDPGILAHVFTHVIADGPFCNCTLHTNFVEVVAGCDDCQQEFNVEHSKFICPVCSKPSSTIIHGNELTIYKIILEEPVYAEVNK